MVLTFSVGAGAAVDQKANSYVLCKNQKNVRTIRVTNDEKQKGSCVVTYSKAGIDEIVGTNRNLEGCKSVLKGIQNNLEASKWNCRNVEASLTVSSDVVVR